MRHGIIVGDVRYRTLGLALAVTVFGASCSSGVDRASEALGSGGSSSPSASASPSASGTDGIPGTGGRAIVVESPLRGDEVVSPVVVRGRAVSADGQVGLRIGDTDGQELAAMNVDVSCGAGCRGEFRAQLAFFTPVEQAGTVEVWVSGAMGEPAGLVQIPVTLVPGV